MSSLENRDSVLADGFVGGEAALQVKREYEKSVPKMVRVDGILDVERYMEFGLYLDECRRKKVEISGENAFMEFYLSDEYKSWFTEGEFADFVRKVVGLPRGEISIRVKRYGAGDFSAEKRFSGAAFYLVFASEGWGEKWGGQRVFVLEDGEDIVVPVVDNSLCVVDSGGVRGEYLDCVREEAGTQCVLVVEGFVK